jgi:1-deoxy-D-xylulose-5-phosphate synthase
MATRGLKPFLAIYSTFMQRVCDMIIHDVALQNLPVRLCMDRAGLSGDDGPTHHGLFDIGIMRHVPNLVFMAPKDEAELVHMLHTMAACDEGPSAMRYPRGAIDGMQVPKNPEILEIGKAEVVADGTDVALFGLGNLFGMAAETKSLLEKDGLSAALINPRFIKPLDTEVIENYARKCRVLCTFEDHVLCHGFGAAVIRVVHDAGLATPVARIAWPDEFVEHGKPEQLRELHGLTPEHAAELVKAKLRDDKALRAK